MRTKRILVGMLTAACVLVTVSAIAAEATEAKKAESISVFSDADLAVPAVFKRVPPKSRIIAHEFQAIAGQGDEAETARVTMMAAGGDVEANIKRWKGQFAGGDREAQKVEQMKLGKWDVHIADVSGSYAERMGGGPFAGGKVVNHENYAMAGAILVHPDGRKYFVKMIGPAKVVKANRKAFVEMIKSIEN